MGEATRPSPVAAAEQLLAEHRRVQEAIASLRRAEDLRELARQARELRTLLVGHFLAEEVPGSFYDWVRTAATRHLERLSRLLAEHEALLAELDALAARAEACLAGPVAAVLTEARRFADRLERHERAEDEVLVDTLYTDLGQGGS